MKWEKIKKNIMKKVPVKIIDDDTIEFVYKGKLFRLHRFFIPNGFLVSNKIRAMYDGKLILLHLVNGEWKIYE